MIQANESQKTVHLLLVILVVLSAVILRWGFVNDNYGYLVLFVTIPLMLAIKFPFKKGNKKNLNTISNDQQ